MKEKWQKIKIPKDAERIIWVFPRICPNNLHVPLIVIQVEKDRQISINYKSSQLNVEVEEI